MSGGALSMAHYYDEDLKRLSLLLLLLFLYWQNLLKPPSSAVAERRKGPLFMVVCVDETPRSHANSLAVTKGVTAAVMEGSRHDSLLARVKQCLKQCAAWPWKVENHKFPVVAEVKGLAQVDNGTMRQVLVKDLNDALGLVVKPKAKKVCE